MYICRCKTSRPCTADELCLLSHLLLLNVLGDEGHNANANKLGEQLEPNASEVGDSVGEADDPICFELEPKKKKKKKKKTNGV